MKNWKQTAFTRRLGVEWPIVQGPFGGGLSSITLTAAACNLGILGSFGVHHLDAEGIRSTAASIKAKTHQPFALNLWLPHEDSDDPIFSHEDFAAAAERLRPYFEALKVPLPQRPGRFAPPFEEQIEAVLAARPAVLSFVFGVPNYAIIERCKENGIATLGTATTRDEAIALANAGVDMLVATGFEAGGHRVSFLQQPESCLTGTMALIPQIVDAVQIPVIAAGGIADGRGIAAALSLGASAAQLGTAFLACEESGASPLHRDALFSSRNRDTGLTRAYSGRLARGIRNELMDALENTKVLPYPAQNWLTGQLKQAAIDAGAIDAMALWAGQAAPLLRHRHVSTLVHSLVQEVDAAVN